MLTTYLLFGVAFLAASFAMAAKQYDGGWRAAYNALGSDALERTMFAATIAIAWVPLVVILGRDILRKR